jgi:hypothetical protein
MNRRILAIIGLIFLGILVYGAGIVTGQMGGTAVAGQLGNGMMNGSMMGNQAAMMGSSGMMNGNMMGNQAAMMGSSGMMDGNMMGHHAAMMGSINPDAEISVTAEEAIPLAQEYLDANLSGSTTGDEVDACPGMYAFQVERDGEIVGMIGVSAYTGQVFLHQ